jgi:internalin A
VKRDPSSRAALVRAGAVITLIIAGCNGGKKESAPASSASHAASSAPPLAVEPAYSCADQECTLTRVTDGIKSALEAMPDYANLKIVFSKDTTDADLKTISKLPWIRVLRIDSENVTDAFPLLPLKDLKRLDISATKIKSLAALATSSGLVAFDAHGVEELEQVAALGSHTGLEELNLTGSSVTDIRAAYNLSSLKRLELEQSKIEDITPLKGCTKLEDLDLDATKVKDLSPIAGLVAMKHLSFAKTSVTDTSPLKDLVDVESIDASESKVRDLSGLKGMKKLVNATFAGAKSVYDIKALVDLKALATLDLSGTTVNDLSALVGLKRLKVLNVNNTSLHDVLRLSQLDGLEDLRIVGTWVTDLAPLRGLKKLRRVAVGKNFPKKKIDELTKANPNITVEVAEK